MRISFHIMLAIIFSLPVKSGFSQNGDFLSGYYINLDSDTVKGLISIAKDDFTVFEYKEMPSGNTTRIGAQKWKSVKAGKRFYHNWYGTRNMAHVDKMTFDLKNMGEFKVGNIPIKLLYEGTRASLFYYFDITPHFFIETGNTIHELTQTYRYSTYEEKKNVIRNPPTYFINMEFREKIAAVLEFELSKKQQYLLSESLLEKQSLIQLFKALNKN